MESTVLLPKLKASSRSAAETVVQILCREWPLSLKEIHYRVTKEYGKQISFQGVHKAVKRLVESKVLLKEDRRYMINKIWLDEIIKFGENMKAVYCNSSNFKFPKFQIKRNYLKSQWE